MALDRAVPTLLGTLAVAGALCASGCDGCCSGDDGNPGTFTVFNDTPYHLHVFVADESALFLGPGEFADFEVEETNATASVLVAPGQGVTAAADVPGSLCCVEDEDLLCGSATARLGEDGTLYVDTSSPSCGGDGGSCPYIYGHDGQDQRLYGEVLTGALNSGAMRMDTLPMPGLSRDGDRYRVRLAAVLAEREHIDAIALEVLAHEPDRTVVGTSGGALFAVGSRAAPGGPSRNVLAAVDGKAWTGVEPFPAGEGPATTASTDLTLSFARPRGARSALLVVEGRNTQALQDATHAFMARFGPGFPKLMRATSGVPEYRPILEELLGGAGFSIDVAVYDGHGGWQVAGRIRPVGPAAVRTIGLPIALPPGDDEVGVRLSALGGAWSLDAVSLGFDARPATRVAVLAPTRARFVGAARVADVTGVVGVTDERAAVVETGERLDLEFAAPRPAPGVTHTPVLRILGYYEVLDPDPRHCLALGALYDSLTTPHAFARFARSRLTAHAALRVQKERRQ
ncbi:MAG: hypothetical protein HYY06_11980 [Deltaproteobacteria bacterium]|nr:hypothetical protein [Deltaproteobacteria bacterium]